MAKVSREFREITDTRSKVDTLGGELIALAKRLDCPTGGNYGNGGGRAALDSLKESGDLEYSGDVVLFLTEAKDDDRTATPPALALDLHLKKQRNGPTGKVPLVFLPDHGIFREEAKQDGIPF